jgi:hypothetical protein
VFKSATKGYRNSVILDMVMKELDSEKPCLDLKVECRWTAWKRVVCGMLRRGAAALTEHCVLKAAENQGILNAWDPVTREEAKSACDEELLHHLPPVSERPWPDSDGDDDGVQEASEDKRVGLLEDGLETDADEPVRPLRCRNLPRALFSEEEGYCCKAKGRREENGSRRCVCVCGYAGQASRGGLDA